MCKRTIFLNIRRIAFPKSYNKWPKTDELLRATAVTLRSKLSSGFACGDAIDEVARDHSQDSNDNIEAGHEAICRQCVPWGHLYVGGKSHIENHMRQQ